MAALSSTLPTGFTPALTADDAVDHTGLITVITAFAMFLVLGSLGIRVYSAYSRRILQTDDWAFAGTVILALAQGSVVFGSVHFGWGKTASMIEAKAQMEKTVYSADILYVATLMLSKASTSIFYRTLGFRNSPYWITLAILGLTNIWFIVAVILISVRCSPKPWHDINKECDILFPRWQAVTALDVILEVFLVLYPVRVIPRLQTTVGKKIIVVMILSCRVVLIPVAAVHLYYAHLQIESTDPTLQGAFCTVVVELHTALSIVVLTAPLMKPFVAAYVDENGLAYTDDASKSRSPISSRSRTPLSRKACEPCVWTEDGSVAYPEESTTDNRIVKSVQFSVDREAIELREQGVHPVQRVIPE